MKEKCQIFLSLQEILGADSNGTEKQRIRESFCELVAGRSFDARSLLGALAVAELLTDVIQRAEGGVYFESASSSNDLGISEGSFRQGCELLGLKFSEDGYENFGPGYYTKLGGAHLWTPTRVDRQDLRSIFESAFNSRVPESSVEQQNAPKGEEASGEQQGRSKDRRVRRAA